MKDKKRLDLLIVEKGCFNSREKAQRAIMAGLVFVDGQIESKPGTLVKAEASIVVKGDIHPYVSRGGLKLEKAIRGFGIEVKGKTAIDVGASTGGFTDYLIQNGAIKVYAIDVGYGQLAWTLRNDSRVIVMERTNIKDVTSDILSEKVDLVVIDVSFISLLKVLPSIIKLINEDGMIIALVKPQFEAGKDKVGKKGVVRDPLIHAEVLQRIISGSEDLGLAVDRITYSPIRGPQGNIEFLLLLSKERNQNLGHLTMNNTIIESIVQEATEHAK
jgi:23S rRNA (cytidine1920-2'-O)/16S rRNA (cytidine1409-2'-O)-methyltransferase